MRASLLVTDSNIWIDLVNGEILAVVFNLPYQFITTDFAKMEDMHAETWAALMNYKIMVLGSTQEQVNEIQQLRKKQPALSITDLASFVLAKDLPAALLSGDKALRRIAEKNGIEVHGVLWVLDQLVDHQVVSAWEAADALESMLAKSARLPLDACRKRIKRWRAF